MWLSFRLSCIAISYDAKSSVGIVRLERTLVKGGVLESMISSEPFANPLASRLFTRNCHDWSAGAESDDISHLELAFLWHDALPFLPTGGWPILAPPLNIQVLLDIDMHDPGWVGRGATLQQRRLAPTRGQDGLSAVE